MMIQIKIRCIGAAQKFLKLIIASIPFLLSHRDLLHEDQKLLFSSIFLEET